MLFEACVAFLLAVPAALAESSADGRDAQQSYDPYRVGQLQRDAAVEGIAQSHPINWYRAFACIWRSRGLFPGASFPERVLTVVMCRAIPSKVLSNRSTTVQRWLTVETSLQCSGKDLICSSGSAAIVSRVNS